MISVSPSVHANSCDRSPRLARSNREAAAAPADPCLNPVFATHPKKDACNPNHCHTSKSKGFKALCLPHIQKRGVGPHQTAAACRRSFFGGVTLLYPRPAWFCLSLALAV